MKKVKQRPMAPVRSMIKANALIAAMKATKPATQKSKGSK